MIIWILYNNKKMIRKKILMFLYYYYKIDFCKQNIIIVDFIYNHLLW